MTPAGAQLLEELVDAIAERLAPVVAEAVAERLSTTIERAPGTRLDTASLLTLDELVATLPASKEPSTWKRWLYGRLRRAEGVPGAVKLGGNWFFDRNKVDEWIRSLA